MTSIPADIIDWTILNEIIYMDEDDPDFSKSLIIQFIDQANTTFDSMQEELDNNKDLSKLDNLGHFLKGSSATLGLQRIAWVCERIQNLGRKDENFFPNLNDLLSTLSEKDSIYLKNLDLSVYSKDITMESTHADNEYLLMITKALNQARIEFLLARKELSRYYKQEL
ncbi:hypothetical protein TBLA_0G00300 [Henningerozyma blattae CBS 6284]|uniref:Phosphorelay intermediate protein YPD1 n=1 Tax=Henningerozyma blattae (strain ATCC 34711 / CBS 6284 / DSM 70876 / NBRC 10599 / NRRL Y-10934 / UCD 77-7) TaxID=1071380 RepID=I2H6H7_HENB6|nr:hypothetical protein TBLA_0G00300 [Tetrapisispora blattae CBS 6284]CCH61979.1 hypothetical protein TBLA_0G00300 [Tetrapisispora blattae CBS 6284]